MRLCGMLRHVHRLHAVDNDNDDDTLLLEHAVLSLWKRLQRASSQGDGGDADADAARDELLAADNTVWSCMARLLFTSDGTVVNATIAVMHALSVPARYRFCWAADGAEGLLDDDARVQLQERMWHSTWRQFMIEKVRDTHARLFMKKGQKQVDDAADDGQCDAIKEAALCVRLLRILGALVASVRTLWSKNVENVEEVLSLLLSLHTSPIWRIAHSAAVTLLSVLKKRDPAYSDVLLENVFVDSPLNEKTAKWLIDMANKQSAVASFKIAKNKKKVSTIEHERGQLQCAYFDLLIHGASAIDGRHERLLQSMMENADPLQVCTLYLVHNNAELQEKALALLTTLLRDPLIQRSHHASTMCTTLRLSGQLIPVAWLMGHSRNGTATAAANLMECVMLNSPKSDLLRAMVEQGCAIIFHTLSSAPGFPIDNSTMSSPNAGTRASPSSEIMGWVAHEIGKEQVLGASVTSLLRSSNVLLQRNVLLSLLLIARVNPEIKQKLRDKEHFADEVVHVMLEANDDASLAAMLLSALLTWSEKCSTLRLDEGSCSSSFRQQSLKSEKSVGTLIPAAPVDLTLPSGVPASIAIKQNDLVVAEIDGFLLHKLSKVARRWVNTNAMQQPKQEQLSMPLDQFREPTIYLFAELLPKSQQEAVIVLKQQQELTDLFELLELAKYLECSKCWHFTTFAINHRLTATNWFSIFQFAVKTRHPSLMLRAGNVALEHYERGKVATNNSNNSVFDTQQDDVIEGGMVKKDHGSSGRFAELKIAAFQMFQEFFNASQE
uniref:Uncharacterized protein n=1 Tax=Globisporangium ultimum (strain ATCC 200006 / CBS 805.95 / DAOM BR144) TaxID=431595 RepID=K3WP65_GLOUD